MHKKIPRVLELPKLSAQCRPLGASHSFLMNYPRVSAGRGLRLVLDGACSMLAVYATSI